VKIKSLQKFYHSDLLVKIINKSNEIIFTGKLSKVPDKLLSKNVYDVNPTLNNHNKIVVELKLGKGEL
jgi:hypothetical protein